MAGKMTEDKCAFCGKHVVNPHLFVGLNNRKNKPCCSDVCFHLWIYRQNGVQNYYKEKIKEEMERKRIIERARHVLERYAQVRITTIPIERIIDPYPPLSTVNVQLYSYDLHTFHQAGTDKPYVIRLSEDIRVNGVKEPITVTVQPNGKYLINDGHNRYTCCKLLGITVIPAIVNKPNTTIDEINGAKNFLINRNRGNTRLHHSLSHAHSLTTSIGE
jgi:hypothetical protein